MRSLLEDVLRLSRGRTCHARFIASHCAMRGPTPQLPVVSKVDRHSRLCSLPKLQQAIGISVGTLVRFGVAFTMRQQGGAPRCLDLQHVRVC